MARGLHAAATVAPPPPPSTHTHARGDSGSGDDAADGGNEGLGEGIEIKGWARGETPAEKKRSEKVMPARQCARKG